MSEVQLETSDWQGLRDDPDCARARKLLSLHELRAIMRHARNYEREKFQEQLEHNRVELGEVEDLRRELGQAQGTLRYLRTQARNGTLHPQVVIQNVDKLLGREP